MLDVLLADDDENVRESVSDALQRAGHNVALARDGEEALALASGRLFDVAICDVQMPRLDGLAVFRRLRRDAPTTAVIIMTSFGKIVDVVGAIRDGAADYVTKPFDADEFADAVIRPIAERRAERRKAERRASARGEDAPGVIADSEPMRALLERLDLMAESDASLVLAGERGTGKKLLARRLHDRGPRREGPFVIVPCTTLPSLLVESERLELEDGFPTRRHAWMRAAEGGTLVLDGIEDLPIPAQGALVRVLESLRAAQASRDGRPRGVRLVSLARDDIASRLTHAFLPTLYFRLSNVTLHVPSLREREADLVPLARQILLELTPPGKRASTLEPGAWAWLSSHSYRGNVDELVQLLARARALAGRDPIDRQHLPKAG